MIKQIEPFIDDEELIQLTRVIKSSFVTESSLTNEFESFFKDYCSIKHAIAYTNGTTALYAILKSLGIGKGDQVILPNLTFIATSNAVIMAGADPVFCDLVHDSFCINLKHAEKLLTPRTKAIIAVHLYGFAENMDSMSAFVKEHNLLLIEDAAQGVGVRYSRQHVGSFGNAGMLSFYGNKTITTGEGGLIITNDDKIAKECYRLKNHGRDEKGIFIHDHIGFNFSFTEMQAAIGLAQVNKLERIISKKKYIFDTYFNRLKILKNVSFILPNEQTTPVHWFTNIIVENAEKLSKYLLEKGIQTRRFFYPLNLQPCYNNLTQVGPYVESEKLYCKGLSLPSSYNITDLELNSVISYINQFYLEEK